MATYPNVGHPAPALIEEMAEATKIIAKQQRFGGNWHDIPPGKSKTRLEMLEEEMEDVSIQWRRLRQLIREQEGD